MADSGKKHFSPALIPMTLVSALFVAVPLVYILVLSFLTKGDIWGVKEVFTLDNYRKLLDPMYADVYLDSFGLAAMTTLVSLLLGYPFSYITAKLPARWRQTVLFLLMAPFWLNSLIRLNGWIILLRTDGVVNAVLTGSGLLPEPAKLLFTPGSVLLGMVYGLFPFMALAIYNSTEKMDWELVEAARDLGASPVRAFLTVTLPQTLPGILAGSILVFVPSVGLFFISDLLGGAKTMLLGNLIKNELLTARNWPFGAALSVVMLGITALFLFIYRRITGKGLQDML
ncbi:MAG: ABC transporter permease [Christensenellales bacterium]|jgi:spermidine/putrescine transport system permease protein